MKRAEFRSAVRFAALAAITATSCFFAQSATALDKTWNGAGTTWGTAANWTGPPAAVPVSGDNAVFTGTFSNQPGLGTTAATVGGVWMTGTPGQSVTISGTGTGILTLNGNAINTIAGLGILVNNTNANTLTISAPVKLGNAQTWTNTSGNVLTLGAIDTNGKALTVNGTGNVTFGGVISSSGPITLAGTGSSVITFTAANTFTGALAIKSGTVSIDAFGRNNADSVLGHSNSSGVPAVTLGDAGGGTATIRYTGPDATGRTKNYSFAAGGTGIFDIVNNVTVALTGTLGGTGSFTKAGPGTLTITADVSTYSATGLTTVSAGVLDVIAGTGGTYFQGGLAGAGTIRSNVSGSQTLTVGGPINTFTGTFELASGSGINQFTFGTNVAANMDGSNAIFKITGSNQDTTPGARGPRFGNTNGTTMKIGALVSDAGGVGSFSPNGIGGITNSVSFEIGKLGGDRVYTGDIMDASDYTRVASLTKVGAGSETFAGANSNYSGPTTVSAGTLIAGANVTSSRLMQKSTTVDLGTDTFTTTNHGLTDGDRVVFDAVSGALGGLTNDSVTYFVIGATANTYQVSTAPGGSAVNITTNTTTGLNVEYGVAPNNVSNKIALVNHGFQNGDKVLLGQSGGTIPTGLTNNKPYFVVNKTDTDFQVSLTAGGTPIDFSTDGTAVIVRRPGALGAGNSAITLGDINTLSNNVAFVTNGEFRVERAINVMNYGSGTTIGGNADANSFFMGDISLAKNLSITSAAVSGTNTVSVSGVISGSGSGISKVGTGKVTLTGANTYTGNTTVSTGTLLVNGTHTGGGTYTVGNGGKLGGTGSISAGIDVLLGGTLAPGASIESFNSGAVSLATGSTFEWEFTTDVPAGDLQNINGNLDIETAGIGVALSMIDLGTPTVLAVVPIATKYTLISYAGMWNGGTFAGLANGERFFFGLNEFRIKYDDHSAGLNGGEYGNYVTLTAVPEASSILVMGLGGIFTMAAVWLGKRSGRNVLRL